VSADPTGLVARLRKLDGCAVSDALDQLGLASGVVTGLLLQGSGASRIAGRAITVKLGVGTPKAGPPKHLGATAVEIGGPDDVIVIEQRSGVEAGSWGGLLSLGAKVKGIAGVLSHGPVRDIDQAIEMSFPIFASAYTSRTARGRIVEIGTNVPVKIGDATVAPGDYVVADRSAVIFIAAVDIERVLAASERILAKEEAMAKDIRAGTPIGAVMGASYEHMLK
jgi:4-hydroxy-4-methyl-2-oxoglutarate aldolase